MEELNQIITKVSWPGAVIGIFFILWKAGVLNAFVAWVTNKHPQQLNRMEEFMDTAETNHYTDLEYLLKETKNIKEEMNKGFMEVRETLARQGERISFLEGKIR